MRMIQDHKIKTGRYADAVRAMLQHSGGPVTDETVLALCEKAVFEDPSIVSFSAAEKTSLIRSVFCTLRCELEILQDLADDPSVSEIMVNGPADVFAERCGKIERQNIAFDSAEDLERLIRRIAGRVGREMNELNPVVDARLSDGSRVNAVNSNIAIGGPVLTIRRFAANDITMEQLIAQGDITPEAADFLAGLVASRYNIFISGGTSSGKTTFLNILSSFIPSQERIVVIEDSAELNIRGHENLVRMEAKNANTQGKGAVTIRDLIRTSLRMRPDRIVVGEVRGEEVVDMLSAMSTGHDGSLSTGHANSARGMAGRLESLFLAVSGFPLEAVRGQIAGAIDIFVHLSRDGDGHRRVMEICELDGLRCGELVFNPLFIRNESSELIRVGQLKNTEKPVMEGTRFSQTGKSNGL